MKGAKTSNHSSPGIMSPVSPLPYDNQSRSSADNGRLRSLEAQSAIHATEVALLRQMTDDFGSWRYRVDSASVQTAHVLEALNKDVQSLKTQITEQSSINSDAVFDQLKEVECQLTATRSLFENQENINTVINTALVDLRTNINSTRDVADAASIDATTAIHQSESLVSQVQALKLGLEVVEQSLEGLDVSEILSSINSRMDDMDVGMEKIAHEAFANVSALESSFAVTKAIAERADATAAETAVAVSSLTKDVADIRSELHYQRQQLKRQQEQVHDAFVTPPSSVTSSPMRASASTTTDPRLKAAVHTLTDGYRSLHRAMTLAYEEQSDLQVRVQEVAHAACALDEKYQDQKKSLISGKKGEMKSSTVVVSHPLSIEVEDDNGDDDTAVADGGEQLNTRVGKEMVEVRALLAAQAAEAAYQSRRADLLEVQLRDMRRLLMSLAPLQKQQQQEEEEQEESKSTSAASSTIIEEKVAVGSKNGVVVDDKLYAVSLVCDGERDYVAVRMSAMEQREGMIAAVY